MKDQPVVQYPEDRLHEKSRLVTDFGTEDLRSLIAMMIATMRKQRGIGLAAPQIGVWLQAAVIEMKDGPLVALNPRIANVSREQEDDEEGCLSVKGVYGVVRRAKRLTLHARGIDGEPYTITASGLLARVIQHEYDHLQGVLFLDHCRELTTGIDRARALGLTIPAR